MNAFGANKLLFNNFNAVEKYYSYKHNFLQNV